MAANILCVAVSAVDKTTTPSNAAVSDAIKITTHAVFILTLPACSLGAAFHIRVSS